jgi:Domain of unknown function (DUF6265)
VRFLFIALLLALSNTGVRADSPLPDLPGWLAGRWTNQEGKKWSEEHWLAPRGNMMLGNSWSGVAAGVKFWEHMRIEREADGTVVFWAAAGDQKPVRFVARQYGPKSIIFENAQHDYPQRIRYWRTGKMLNAEISKIDGSEPAQFRFRLAAGR